MKMMLCSARSRLFFGPRLFIRWLRTQGDASEKNTPKHLVGGKSYAVDEFTNVPPSILRLLKSESTNSRDGLIDSNAHIVNLLSRFLHHRSLDREI